MNLKELLRQCLKDEIDRQGKDALVVWYDQSGTFQPLAEHVLPTDTQLITSKGSYLAIRFEMEHRAPKFEGRWVVYIPESSLPESWLRDWELFGNRFDLDLLGLLSRRFEFAVTPQLSQLLRDHPENSRELIVHWEELLAHHRRITPETIIESLLAITMGLSSWKIEEAVLIFMCGDGWQERLNRRGLWQSFYQSVQAFGGWVSLPEDEIGLRKHLQANTFLSELIVAIPSLTERFVSFLPAEDKRRAISEIARIWRGRESLRKQYILSSKKIEQEYEISDLLTTDEHLLSIDTFSGFDTLWRHAAVESIATDGSNYLQNADRIRQIANARVDGFWAREHQAAYWFPIKLAADLYEGSRHAIEESESLHTIHEFVSSYTAEDGWWQLDRFALESAAHASDLKESERERLLYPAWQLYGEYLDRVNRSFIDAVKQEGWQPSHLTFWNKYIHATERTAVLMVDAMRFDLAHSLLAKLRVAGLQVSVESLQGVLPSVTEVGMSALLPEAHSGLELIIEKSHLRVQLRGQNVTNREGRLSWLDTKLAKDRKIVRLDQIEQESLDGVSLLVVLSRELDAFGTFAAEIDPAGLIDLVDRLDRVVNKLANDGFERIILAPDHGFLFLPPGVKTRKIGRPSTGVIKPRFAIGVNPDGCFSKPAHDLGLVGDLILAFPIGLSCLQEEDLDKSVLKQSRVFLHGGLSLQEAILPILDVKPAAITTRVGATMELPVSLTSRIALIKVKAVGVDMFAGPRNVAVEICGHRSQAIELSGMQPESTVRVEWLGFSDEPPAKLDITLIDINSGAVLETKSITVELFM